jgi:hypothetical protein
VPDSDPGRGGLHPWGTLYRPFRPNNYTLFVIYYTTLNSAENFNLAREVFWRAHRTSDTSSFSG